MCNQSRPIQTKRWKRTKAKHSATLFHSKESLIRKPSAYIIVPARRIIQHILCPIQRANTTNAVHELHHVSQMLT